MRNLLRKIGSGQLAVGPGIFAIGYTVGTGSVTSMAKVGSQFGTSGKNIVMMRKSILLVFVVCGVACARANPWPATDALGRALPEYQEVGAPRKDRFVAMFYFLWQHQHTQTGPHDISKILAEHPEAIHDGSHLAGGGRPTTTTILPSHCSAITARLMNGSTANMPRCWPMPVWMPLFLTHDVVLGAVEDYPKTLMELERRFATEEACRAYLFQLRRPSGFHCPRCGHEKAWSRSDGLLEFEGCKYKVSAKAGTIFEGSRKPLVFGTPEIRVDHDFNDIHSMKV